MNARGGAELGTLQQWLQAVVTHPDGVGRGIASATARRLIPGAAADPAAVVLPSKSLDALDRLGIYAHMYWARLLEILEEEYPTTRRVLGEAAFERAGRRFLHLHPSTHRTLSLLSAGFPAFLARHLPAGPRKAFAVDVARIERAMEDVFDAPQAEPLGAADFAAIGGEQWHRVGLALVPAARLLGLTHPANDYMNALRAGRRPRIPRPRASWVIVYRRDYRLHRQSLTREQYRLLAALAAGRPLAEAVGAALAGQGDDAARLAAQVGGWFRQWSAAGLFASLTGPAAGAGRA
jgi:hypothetical protein